jgi:hypothetical protein
MINLDEHTQDILNRLKAILEDDLSDDEIAARIKKDFTEEEQAIVTDLILGDLEEEESERYFPE